MGCATQTWWYVRRFRAYHRGQPRSQSDSIVVSSPQTTDLTPARVRFPLRAKLGLLTGLTASVAPLALGVYVIDANRLELERSAREYRIAVLDDISRAVDDEIVDSADALDTIARTLVDRELTEDARITAALSFVAGSSTLDHASIYDAAGAQIDTIREATARDIEPPPQLDAAAMQEARGRNASVGGVYSSARGARLSIVVPIRVNDELTGFAASLISLERIRLRVLHLSEERFPAAPGALYLVDRSARLIVHPNQESADFGLSPSIADELDLGSTTTFSARRVDARGVDTIFTSRPLSGPRWIAVAEQPAAVVFASLEPLRWAVLAATTVAILGALLGAWVVAGRLTRPIERLVDLTRRIAGRRFDSSVEVRTGDELEILGGALNHAASELSRSERRIREEEAIRHDLGRYLPAELVERVVRREQDMALGGSRRQLTVLFADVVGFTPLTERLAPEETVSILNELFSILTEIVFRNGGTIDKFVGDSVMALYGAPADDPDHAAHALATAEEMLRWLETGNIRWKERYGVTIQLAIAAHTGECVVGNIGSETRMDYTAIGDVVNLAARLESIARPQQILISSETRLSAGDAFDYGYLGERQIVGRRDPVSLYEVRP